MEHKIVILYVTENLKNTFPYVSGDICSVKKDVQGYSGKYLVINSICGLEPGNGNKELYYNAVPYSDRFANILLLKDTDLCEQEEFISISGIIGVKLAAGSSIQEVCDLENMHDIVIAAYCDYEGKPLEHELAKLLIETKDV